jgi:DNA processing protein
LLTIPDPPVLLYAIGGVSEPDNDRCGQPARNQSGLRHAHDFSAALSQAGITVSSGLAAGIDAAAHQAR